MARLDRPGATPGQADSFTRNRLDCGEVSASPKWTRGNRKGLSWHVLAVRYEA